LAEGGRERERERETVLIILFSPLTFTSPTMARLSALIAVGALLLRGSLACRATEDLALDVEATVFERVSAAPVPEDKTGLRLLKTSEEDPGTWVTEEEKIADYILKHVHFMDVTETQDLESLGEARHQALAKRQTAFPAPSRQAIANPIIARLVQSNVQTTITGLANIYSRYYRGSYAATSATHVLNLVRNAASANPAITVRQFTHSFNQPSVIATIPGTSTARRVVVCAHYDTINDANLTGRAPGGDDNASVSGLSPLNLAFPR
jgi:peptidase M28-like protein